MDQLPKGCLPKLNIFSALRRRFRSKRRETCTTETEAVVVPQLPSRVAVSTIVEVPQKRRCEEEVQSRVFRSLLESVVAWNVTRTLLTRYVEPSLVARFAWVDTSLSDWKFSLWPMTIALMDEQRLATYCDALTAFVPPKRKFDTMQLAENAGALAFVSAINGMLYVGASAESALKESLYPLDVPTEVVHLCGLTVLVACQLMCQLVFPATMSTREASSTLWNDTHAHDAMMMAPLAVAVVAYDCKKTVEVVDAVSDTHTDVSNTHTDVCVPLTPAPTQTPTHTDVSATHTDTPTHTQTDAPLPVPHINVRSPIAEGDAHTGCVCVPLTPAPTQTPTHTGVSATHTDTPTHTQTDALLPVPHINVRSPIAEGDAHTGGVCVSVSKRRRMSVTVTPVCEERVEGKEGGNGDGWMEDMWGEVSMDGGEWQPVTVVQDNSNPDVQSSTTGSTLTHIHTHAHTPSPTSTGSAENSMMANECASSPPIITSFPTIQLPYMVSTHACVTPEKEGVRVRGDETVRARNNVTQTKDTYSSHTHRAKAHTIVEAYTTRVERSSSAVTEVIEVLSPSTTTCSSSSSTSSCASAKHTRTHTSRSLSRTSSCGSLSFSHPPTLTDTDTLVCYTYDDVENNKRAYRSGSNGESVCGSLEETIVLHSSLDSSAFASVTSSESGRGSSSSISDCSPAVSSKYGVEGVDWAWDEEEEPVTPPTVSAAVLGKSVITDMMDYTHRLQMVAHLLKADYTPTIPKSVLRECRSEHDELRYA